MNEIEFIRRRASEIDPGSMINRINNRLFQITLTGCNTVGRHAMNEYTRECVKCKKTDLEIAKDLFLNLDPVICDTYINGKLIYRYEEKEKEL